MMVTAVFVAGCFVGAVFMAAVDLLPAVRGWIEAVAAHRDAQATSVLHHAGQLVGEEDE